MNKYLNLALGVGIIALALSIIIKPTPDVSQQPQEDQTMPTPTMQFEKAEQVTEEGKAYSVTLATSEGDITILLSNSTPITTNNFVFLTQQGYYNNTIFHRVMEGFMIQGGDPTGTGSGNPGYRFDDEPFEGEYTRGTVAMANSGPNTNGAQFFIMHQDYALPPNYVIFGTVTQGLDVVDKIATAEVTPSITGEMSTPVNPVSINSATVEEL